ncbi:unnamed protein product [Brassica rapa]|uniref:Uncharacterized protein n=1 Tax=Brassica campestris TaxID=3711 RepID=A0A8D9HL86_BRACM|nr:unnamed protein product [Brassica rapa]
MELTPSETCFWHRTATIGVGFLRKRNFLEAEASVFEIMNKVSFQRCTSTRLCGLIITIDDGKNLWGKKYNVFE